MLSLTHLHQWDGWQLKIFVIFNNAEVQFSLNTYLDEPCVDILDVDDHIRLGVSQASNIWPRVKPGDLDQTDGDFSTIIHWINTQCPSGYIIRIHDIISTRLYCYWLASILLSHDTILTWCDCMMVTWLWHDMYISNTLNQTWTWSRDLSRTMNYNCITGANKLSWGLNIFIRIVYYYKTYYHKTLHQRE